ncbi:phage head closure protein [Martelella endophytica]|uniref:Head-tail adaptor protein n=1 Tax=Martelella endophytica TaxID=1486262 RepID=A0A0D5LXZ7_MAREN|nr:phage head closure protein [Martelella endophytica]AJY48343.1 head-tail adaptor protein [Martelella endophytica]
MQALDPGAFSVRLELLSPVSVSDGQGGAEISYSLVERLWARLEPVSIGFDEEANGSVVRVTHEIWMRARSDLAPGMRLRMGSRNFAINGWRDPDETGRYTVCRTEEVGL